MVILPRGNWELGSLPPVSIDRHHSDLGGAGSFDRLGNTAAAQLRTGVSALQLAWALTILIRAVLVPSNALVTLPRRNREPRSLRV